MKTFKIYASAAIFLILTAARLLVPQLSEELAQGLNRIFTSEQEQTAAMIELGASIAKTGIFEAFTADDEEPAATEAVVTPTPTPSPTVSAAAVQTEAPETSQPAPEPTVPAAVSAFLESQAAYSNYPIPANVTYEVKKLPFEYTSPVNGVTSSGFGYRLHPIANEVKYHYGTDFAADTGTEVRAFADGKIRANGENDSYGKYVIIDHADGYSTLYAHCSKVLIGSGQVSAGDVIALVGESGGATGPHLHFELMCGSVYLNPEFYF